MARLSSDASLEAAPGYGIGGFLDAVLTDTTPSSPPEAGGDDAYWMQQALLCAMAAHGRASPNPTVGAVIVKDGVLIAAGATEPYGLRHAERCAIDNAPDRAALRGATIYTTLEPCAHWGKQPPCADLVASCGFARCVTGIRDPDPRVAGVGLDRVRRTGTEVSFGVLRNEILAWHLPYLTQRVIGRPLVSAVAVADGWDAADGTRRYRDWLRRQCDVLVTDPAAAFEPEAWRGVVWWDTGGRLSASDLGTRARDLGVPVFLVCDLDGDDAARLEADLGVRVVSRPGGLRAYTASAEFAKALGEPPNWILIDDHPRLAGALTAADEIDVVHTMRPAGLPDAVFAGLTGITHNEVPGAVIDEYYAKHLLSALAGTAW